MDKCWDIPRIFASGATARAVMTSKLPRVALRPFGSDSGVELERFAHAVEKFRAKAPRLDQRDRSLNQAGDDYPRQSRAGSNVCPSRAGPGLEAHELRRVEDMPLPYDLQR